MKKRILTLLITVLIVFGMFAPAVSAVEIVKVPLNTFVTLQTPEGIHVGVPAQFTLTQAGYVKITIINDFVDVIEGGVLASSVFAFIEELSLGAKSQETASTNEFYLKAGTYPMIWDCPVEHFTTDPETGESIEVPYPASSFRIKVSFSTSASGTDTNIDVDHETTGKTGWEKQAGYWFYYKNGNKVTGWNKIDNVWYYMNSNGIMQVGWIKSGGKWYYLRPSTGAMVTGWQNINGKWYYLNNDGIMQTGWVLYGGKYYYLGTNGDMKTGWQKLGGKWYYLGGNGIMRTDWQKISGNWYYFGGSGIMRTGWQKINGRWYKFSSDGVWVS